MKKSISLTGIILFLLVTIRLATTEYDSSFGLVFTYSISFIILFSYLLLDIMPRVKEDIIKSMKVVLLILLMMILIIIPVVSNMYNRVAGDPRALYHDGIVQTEEAIKFLFAGKNFYTEDYTNTPVADWSEGKISELISRETIVNPAIYHNIYLPFYVLVSAPFYWVSHAMFGWYDQRIVLLLALAGVILLLFKKGGTSEKTLFVTALFALNPMFLRFFIEGRNDIFTIFLITLSVYFLSKQKLLLSSIPFALACVSKHTAWLLLPFYWWYVYFQVSDQSKKITDNIKTTLKRIYPIFIIGAVFIVPFLIWDFGAFWEDVFLYPSGKLPTSYPITGYGFSQLMLMAKVGVKTIHDYYPFWILQLIVSAPLLFFLYRYQKRNKTVSAMLVSYGLFIFVFWLFSRFFNDNYITYIFSILIIAYFFNQDESNPIIKGISE
ncbi:MAG: glycosyltransferase 87 family protein [Patescibacteria group bacterium]